MVTYIEKPINCWNALRA